MSPRHFTKATFGPYYLSQQHYINAVPNTPQTKFEKFTYVLFKYTGINKLLDLYFSPPKIKPQFEHLPYQTRPEVPEAEVEAAQAEEPQPIDLKALREKRRVEKQSDQ